MKMQFGGSRLGVKKIIAMTTVVVIVMLAFITGISVYSAPGNQLSRRLALGERYLTDGEYESAIVAFEAAIAIDDKCMEAYVGGIEAYSNMNDKEALEVFYERALHAVGNLDESQLEQNMDYVVSIYLSADSVYHDEPEKVVEVLEEGWVLTENPKVREALIEEYLAIAEEKVRNGDYEGALVIYDRLLVLAQEDARILEALGKCLTAYLDWLMEEGKYDEIRKLAEKYKAIVPGIDFNGLLKQIDEKERRTEELAGQEESERDTEQEIQTEMFQEESTGEPEGEETESEDIGTEPEENENISAGDTMQSGNWVDDLYQKIIAEDVNAVFAIMKAPDFIEKCEAYPHKEVVWSIDYRLSTSDGSSVWVVKAIDYDGLSIAYCPSDENNNMNEAPPVYAGDYLFSIENGVRGWFLGTTFHYSDGNTIEIGENELFETFHV